MSDDPDLVSRVRRLEDRAEIGELIQRYAVAVDDGDEEAITDVYTADAQFVGRTGQPMGHEAILAYLRAHREENGTSVHAPSGQILEWVDDDRARGIVICQSRHEKPGRVLTFRYLDQYVRQGDRWRFAKRELSRVLDVS